MQVVFWIIFVVIFLMVLVIAIAYCVGFNMMMEKYEKLEEKYEKTFAMEKRYKMIRDLVKAYRKDVTNRNAYMTMKEISDVMLQNKIELDTDQSN